MFWVMLLYHRFTCLCTGDIATDQTKFMFLEEKDYWKINIAFPGESDVKKIKPWKGIECDEEATVAREGTILDRMLMEGLFQ